MTFPKFVIDGDVLVIGKCNRHSQLSFEPKDVKGGGFWTITEIDGVKSIVFSGSSFDYGEASIEDLKNAIAAKKVFTNKTHLIEFDCGVKDFYYSHPASELIKLN